MQPATLASYERGGLLALATHLAVFFSLHTPAMEALLAPMQAAHPNLRMSILRSPGNAGIAAALNALVSAAAAALTTSIS
jgi:hypothetical protein